MKKVVRRGVEKCCWYTDKN